MRRAVLALFALALGGAVSANLRVDPALGGGTGTWTYGCPEGAFC